MCSSDLHPDRQVGRSAGRARCSLGREGRERDSQNGRRQEALDLEAGLARSQAHPEDGEESQAGCQEGSRDRKEGGHEGQGAVDKLSAISN